ncbi:class I SAM-dependent methyltransferase [Hydrogenimonas urashimensis]|uniref:class I SAM-dependent methyltransferase n=1 Tax=Hydrogenimonas urashimensis TaxID=2740515 RepID=UPI001915488D|nr:class I SAM-dependent methyltransferase [Hydrogenimonas urashimensis]
MSFDERARTWDASKRRQALAESVAEAIRDRFALDSSMLLLDVGAGTGLLTRRLLPSVGKMVALDTSTGMLEQLRANLMEFGEKIEAVHSDIMAFETTETFDGIVSSMTLHHIPNTDALLRKLHGLVRPGGFIALADLAPEDGTFHDHGNEGVWHFGFEEKSLKESAKKAGFSEISYRIVHRVQKCGKRRYDIFLLGARIKDRAQDSK